MEADDASRSASSEVEGEETVVVNEGQLVELRGALTANPQDYDAHVQLIAALRAACRTVELRDAREEFSKRFPLTEGTCLASRCASRAARTLTHNAHGRAVATVDTGRDQCSARPR